MKLTHFDIRGESVPPADLEIPKARDLAIRLAAERIDFARLVECRYDGHAETVVIDIDVEVAQIQRHPIRPCERIAVTFFTADDTTPTIDALRTDFPRVPHLNLHRQEYPRNLCLYDTSYDDLKRRWTSPKLVHDIRSWLALTSQGRLHHDDQPLEPLLLDYHGHIILPQLSPDNDQHSVPLFIGRVERSRDTRPFLFAETKRPTAQSKGLLASVHHCAPQTHGIIWRIPKTLPELASITASAGLDLLAELRARLRNWHADDDSVLEAHLLLIILFPKKRHDDDQTETVDTWAFFLVGNDDDTHSTRDLDIRELGTRIGLWDLQDNQVGHLLKTDTSRHGDSVGVAVLNVAHNVDPSTAAKLNGQSPADELHLAAIGVGALGSQVAMNLARSGYGRWTLIDHDILMPHNMVRHALDGSYVGWNKAEAMAVSANTIVSGPDLFSAIPADLLHPGDRDNDLSTALTNADAILDMSASVSVARALAHRTGTDARRMSLFLSPSGHDLVLLAEDEARSSSIDALEMQYYRAILTDTRLADHLQQSDDRYRYAQSCRDVTSRIPQYMVARHASQGAHAVSRTLRTSQATISIWRTTADDVGQRIDVTPAPTLQQSSGNWTMIADHGLLDNLATLRQSSLPNETGGVLLGSFDMARRILYIAHALPAPPDSEEWPTLYIRGSEGLAENVIALTKTVHDMLEYVGEWHSHPDGADTAPSQDDLKVLAWIKSRLETDGLPGVMMIVGPQGRTSWHLTDIQVSSSEATL